MNKPSLYILLKHPVLIQFLLFYITEDKMNVFIFILLFPFLSSLQYDEYKNPMDNIGMQDSLLSRFDLLFIVLDQVSQTLLISEIIFTCISHPMSAVCLGTLNNFEPVSLNPPPCFLILYKVAYYCHLV